MVLNKKINKKFTLNKKAQTFTIISIIVAGVLIAWFFVSEYSYPKTQEKEKLTTKVIVMNSFLKDIDKDFDRALYISGQRAILSMLNIIVENGTFFSNLSSSLDEIMKNGTYKGISQELIFNSTLNSWSEKIKYRASQTGINVSVDISDIEAKQVSPWTIEISCDLHIYLTDIFNTAQWNVDKKKKVNISIIGFEDPIYAIYSFGRVTNVIQKTMYEGNYVNGNDTSNLKTHLMNGYYTESNSAPDFLMRLQGNLSASVFGIESLVNLERFSAEKLPILAKTVVDYIYFSNNSPECWSVSEMPNWFYMDNLTVDSTTHLKKYQVDNLI